MSLIAQITDAIITSRNRQVTFLSATLTDLECAIQLITTGKKDPESTTRVEAETEKITEGIRRKHGVLNIAVDLIREAV